MSGVVANESFKGYMGMAGEENYNSALMGAIVALYEIGCMAGALSTGKALLFISCFACCLTCPPNLYRQDR